MSDSAVRYVTEPDPITDLIPEKGGGFRPYNFRSYLLEFVVPRLPNGTAEQNAIVQRVIALITGNSTRWEMREAVWSALVKALPQLGDKKEPAIQMPVYLKVQAFYAAVLGAPDTEPKGWRESESEAQPEVAQAAE